MEQENTSGSCRVVVQGDWGKFRSSVSCQDSHRFLRWSRGNSHSLKNELVLNIKDQVTSKDTWASQAILKLGILFSFYFLGS